MLRRLVSRIFSVDERFVMHRYYSTRLSVIVGAVLAGTWIYYDYFTKGVLQVELLIVLLVMAATKIGSMIYYRQTH